MTNYEVCNTTKFMLYILLGSIGLVFAKTYWVGIEGYGTQLSINKYHWSLLLLNLLFMILQLYVVLECIRLVLDNGDRFMVRLQINTAG